jgi:hypothetical protein
MNNHHREDEDVMIDKYKSVPLEKQLIILPQANIHL